MTIKTFKNHNTYNTNIITINYNANRKRERSFGT